MQGRLFLDMPNGISLYSLYYCQCRRAMLHAGVPPLYEDSCMVRATIAGITATSVALKHSGDPPRWICDRPPASRN